MTLQSELRILSGVFPADRLIYVGGPSFDPGGLIRSIRPASVVAVMGLLDDIDLGRLGLPAGSELIREIVLDRVGRATWFKFDMFNESGVIPPDVLKTYWRNIQLVESSERPVTTLDALANEERLPEAGWLVIDLMSAGWILAGGARVLQTVDVIVTRCVLGVVSGGIEQSAIGHIGRMLSRLGFLEIARAPGRQADVGHVLFARNWKQVMADRLAAKERQGRDALNSVSAELDAARTDLEAKTTELAKLRTECESAISEREALVERLNVRSRDSEKYGQIFDLLGDIKGNSDDARRKLSGIVEDVRDMRQLGFASLPGSVSRIPEFLLAKAEQLYDKGDYRRSAEYYRAVLNHNPESAWAVQGLAESIARMTYSADVHWFGQDTARAIDETGKWDVTVRLYRKALALDPGVGSAFSEVHPAAEHEGVGVPDPVFIVGCGHSGTSILLRVLGEHPDLMPVPKESAIFLQSDQAIRKTMEAWDKECLEAGKRRWIEKTPPHIFQMRRFLQMRPQSQFILLLRDGRDVVHSLRHRVGYKNVEDRIERWVYDNVAGLPLWGHPQVKVVRYEDFVEDTYETVRALFAFLNVDPGAHVLGYHEKEARWYSDRIEKPQSLSDHDDHKGLRNWQINQPVFDGRAKWKDEMPESERKAFRSSKAQALLEQFGYVENDGW